MSRRPVSAAGLTETVRLCDSRAPSHNPKPRTLIAVEDHTGGPGIVVAKGAYFAASSSFSLLSLQVLEGP